MAEGYQISPRPKPTTLTRPLSENQTSPWTFTAPSDGILYVLVISNVRIYSGVSWNGQVIGGFAFYNENTGPTAFTNTYYLKKGDSININNLTENCYVSSQTAFISFD